MESVIKKILLLSLYFKLRLKFSKNYNEALVISKRLKLP